MKKILSLVLVLSLVLGSFGMAFADTDTATTTTTPKDVVGTDYEGAVTALSALGVVKGYEDGNYKPANVVTRAEMAQLIIAELGLSANASGAKSTFTDLSGYGWAEGAIGYAQSLGIINGYGDGTFKPGQTVSYDEALTMIVSALGYTKDCKEMNGAWPAIYVQKARVLGITDDVKAGGATGANRGDIAIYLYNMLTADMGYADADGVYVTKKDKNNNPIKVITNLDAEEVDYDIISKDDADDALANIKAYVGACAKVFVMNKGKNDGKIVAISDVKSEFVTGEYSIADKTLTAADGTEYKLDSVMNNVAGTSTEKFIKDAKNYTAREFVNGDDASAGSTVLDTDGTAFDTKTAAKDNCVVTIAADLSGKTVKGVYSVSMWGKGTNATVVAERVDAEDLKAITANKTLLGKEFTQNDNDEIDFNSFELVGVSTLSDIKADHVVYVYAGGKDNEITRVAVGTEVVKGEITKLNESDTNAKVTIDGKDYKLADQKLGGNNGISAEVQLSDLDAGDEVQLYLDAYGYAYDYDAVSGKADNYAIVLETGKGTGIGSKNEIKLFLADGTDKIFQVDSDLFKSKEKAVDSITSTSGLIVTAGAIVKYGVDKDGVIDSFESFSVDKKGDKVKDYKYEGVTTTAITGLVGTEDQRADQVSKESDITKAGYFNGYEINKNAVMYSFNGKAGAPSSKIDITDEDEYGITTLEKVLDKSDVRASYVVYKNKIVAMMMYDFSDSDNLYGVVTGAKKTSGDADYEITMLVDGVKKTYPAKESAYSTATATGNQTANDTAGDKLFRISFNASGEIKELIAANLASEISNKEGDTYCYAEVNVASDTSTDYRNNVFTVTSGSEVSATPSAITTGNEIRLQRDAVVYYNDKNDFATGTLSDLKGLKAGSKVWFFDTLDDKNNLINAVVVYKTGSTNTPAPTPGGDDTIANDATTVEIVTNLPKSEFSGVAVNGAFLADSKYIVIDKKVIISDIANTIPVGKNTVSVYYASKTVEKSISKLPTVATAPSLKDKQGVLGDSVTFDGTAGNLGGGTATYQWYKDGTLMVGETNATLTIASYSATDNGAYKVVITNTENKLTSTFEKSVNLEVASIAAEVTVASTGTNTINVVLANGAVTGDSTTASIASDIVFTKAAGQTLTVNGGGASLNVDGVTVEFTSAASGNAASFTVTVKEAGKNDRTITVTITQA